MSPDFEFRFGLRLRGWNGVFALLLVLAMVLSVILGSPTVFNEAARIVNDVVIGKADGARPSHFVR